MFTRSVTYLDNFMVRCYEITLSIISSTISHHYRPPLSRKAWRRDNHDSRPRPSLAVIKQTIFIEIATLQVNKYLQFLTGDLALRPYLIKLAKAWWKEPDTGVPMGANEGCSAARMWRAACSVLVCPDADAAWGRISETAPPDSVWHSLRNCVAYQAGVWQNLLTKGIDDVMQPAAFKLAIVLRHSPTDLTVRLLADLLHQHPQCQDLTSYVLALLTDDEAAWCGACGAGTPGGESPGPAPLRDLQLFGDCELAILAASREEYEAHAKLVRAEYAALSNKNYVELRIKVLNQFSQIPKLYNTPEFECFEPLARENIEREICTLREHLLTGQEENE